MSIFTPRLVSNFVLSVRFPSVQTDLGLEGRNEKVLFCHMQKPLEAHLQEFVNFLKTEVTLIEVLR